MTDVSNVVTFFNKDGEARIQKRAGDRIVEFNETFPVEAGWAVMVTITPMGFELPDAFDPNKVGKTLLFEAQLKNAEGVVLRNAFSLEPITSYKALERADTNVVLRLASRCGLNPEIVNEDELRQMLATGCREITLPLAGKQPDSPAQGADTAREASAQQTPAATGGTPTEPAKPKQDGGGEVVDFQAQSTGTRTRAPDPEGPPNPAQVSQIESLSRRLKITSEIPATQAKAKALILEINAKLRAAKQTAAAAS